MTEVAAIELSFNRPFPGLRPYEFEDHGLFFGRGDQSFSLYNLLDHSRFIAVVGSSGSGKSSLVHAGLLPLLKQEADSINGRAWVWAEMRPGNAPLDSLVEALAELSDDDGNPVVNDARADRIAMSLRQSSFGLGEALDEIEHLGKKSLVIIVDQFEELFRYASSPGRNSHDDERRREEATRLVQLLLQIARDREREVHVLITMRSDFIGDCARFQGLPEAVSATQFLVPSLTRDQREEAICKPIAQAGGTIDADLVQQLLNDSGSDPDQLPVLQHCLMRLWDRAAPEPAAGAAAGTASPASGAGGATDLPAAPRTLNLDHYASINGMSGALSQHADEILNELPGLELAVEQVFRALSEVDKDERATRRSVELQQLYDETGLVPEDVKKVVDRFRKDDCSFLLPSRSKEPKLGPGTWIDVGHEALLRRWGRVSGGKVTVRGITAVAQRAGWLWAEENDGQLYRVLLSMADSDGTGRIRFRDVEKYWKWWNERPRTKEWAERYGGGFDRVKQLFKDSRAARRRLTAAVGVATVIIVGVTGFQSWQWYRARSLAIEEAMRATEMARAMNDAGNNLVNNVLKEFRNREGMPVELTDKVVRFAEGLFTKLGELKEIPRSNLQRARATLLSAKVEIYLINGDKETALQTAEEYQRVVKDLISSSSTRAVWNEDLSAGHGILGDVQAAMGRRDEAIESYHNGLSVIEKSVANEKDSEQQQHLLDDKIKEAEWQQHLLHDKIGDILRAEGRKQPAVEAYMRSFSILEKRAAATINDTIGVLEKLASVDPGNYDWREYLSRRYEMAGDRLSVQGRLQEAIEAYNRGVTVTASDSANNILQKLSNIDPNNPRWPDELAFRYEKQGDSQLAHHSPNPQEAWNYYGKALAIRERLSQTHSGNAVHAQRVMEIKKKAHGLQK